MKHLALAAALALAALPASAQITYYNPTPNGGYIARTPGGPPTYYNPTPDGGFISRAPSGPPTFYRPTPNGGYMSTAPGGRRLPNYDPFADER